MLLKFKHIRSRESINAQMMQKFNDILAQYMKEVSGYVNLFCRPHAKFFTVTAFEFLHFFIDDQSTIMYLSLPVSEFLFLCVQVEIIRSLFESGKDDPPLAKNQPPTAGAIAWERSLFQRIKHTIIRFQSAEEMLNTEAGKSVSSSFRMRTDLSVGRASQRCKCETPILISVRQGPNCRKA